MNDTLVKALAEQAVAAVQNRPNGTCEMDKYNQKFAELIVDECARHIMNSSDRNRREFFAVKIKNHFGIES